MGTGATPLSVCVTTLNNAATIERCLASVAFAQELIVLDSGSDDETVAIARRYAADVHTRAFDDYGPQKQAAVNLARHDWVLLLDADEALTAEAATEIQSLLRSTPACAGYRLPRIEQMFWTWQHPATRANRYLRLFDRRRGGLNDKAVHAAPEVSGTIGDLRYGFLHYGEPSIATKVDKINAYSSGLVQQKQAEGARFVRLRMLFYPPFAFFRSYVLKRQFRNGWAGFINAVTLAYYAFLKYAKLYEHRRRGDQSDE